MIKILILEHPIVVPTLIKCIKHLDKTDNTGFELLVAPSVLEAQARLYDVDMAIIDISREGRALAEIALNKIGIPVIVTSDLIHDMASIRESPNLRLIVKPKFSITKFTQAIRDFTIMVHNRESNKQITQDYVQRVRVVMAPQIASLN